MPNRKVAVWYRRWGKYIYLGLYEEFDEACRVRREAELKYYGFNKD